MKKRLTIILTAVILFAVLITGCMNYNADYKTPYTENKTNENSPEYLNKNAIKKDGTYSSTSEVAYYIHIYGKLPSNFITKKEARDLGWDSDKGNLWEVTDKKIIGGDVFGNREKNLPSKSGRKWYECDVNYNGGFRGDDRIVFSNDGLIYYSDDHYSTFKKLY